MTPEAVCTFWFGALSSAGTASPDQVQRWWRKSPEFDREVRERFEADWTAIVAGQREAWLEHASSRLAYVIVLDQFARNMWRGSPRAFEGDARALQAVRDGVDCGHDRALRGHERVFFYMPFMHSELLTDQERCIELFSAFAAESSGELQTSLQGNVDYARKHRDVIARFGRFPHRNQVLGRVSTPAELEFLKEPGSSF